MNRIVTILLFLFANSSIACSCVEDSRNLELAFEKAETVALVRICESHIEKHTYTANVLEPGSDNWESVTREEPIVVASGFPEKLFKGSHTEKVKFDAGNPSMNCHVGVAVGRVYLAFISSDGEASLNFCSPTIVHFGESLEFTKKLDVESSNNSLNADACYAGAD